MKFKLLTFSALFVFCFVPFLAAQSVVDATLNADGTQVASLSNPVILGGGGSRALGAEDDFNRPDGTNMGLDWNEVSGDMGIFSNQGIGYTMSYMIHDVRDQYQSSTASVDFLPSTLGPSIIYTALIAGENPSGDLLFVKVQDNDSDGLYDRVYFYKNHNGGTWGASPFYFDLAVPTKGGRMTLSFDNTGDTAKLEIDRDFDGIIDEGFTAGDILAAGLSLGDGFGIATWNNQNTYDNWELNGGAAPATLHADVDRISANAGGRVNFKLTAGPANGKRNYILLGSITGNSPGTALPDGKVLPINWDFFTNVSIEFANTKIFDNTLGTLDANGDAAAAFDTLGPMPPVTVGLFFDFAYPLAPKAGIWFASSNVTVEVVP